ncbi:LysR substrate-binding domain-containing protein [Pelagicoccus sp. SDUM812003]|uniref:LysR family transcriptional regulator n=1 Tax=Pelagicoccus sp. SDUM812003 TaxID=3041267 RepID=UPI00280EC369|nr:LysR substrate-binding domain-containing protein [Pelagicoccus sp. SDUM812003]MDQ8203408.1 LysR substrate-binding domain-containing protein [Pelagicoccus sp. SDUM812003]
MRYFIEVALEENVTRAAEKLHVSQPALSRQVRDLEDELGFPLFRRSAKSVALTEAGRVFLEEASEVLARLDQGVLRAKEAASGESGDLHVGYAPSLTVKILPPTIRAFQERFPKVKVKLHDLSSEEMLQGLRKGTLDLACLPENRSVRASGFRFEVLRMEPMALAVGASHRLAKRKRAKLEEVSGDSLLGYDQSEYPEYGSMVREIFASAGIDRSIEGEHESVTSLVTSVEAGMGVAIVTESISCVAGGRIRLLEISPAPNPLVVGIAWREQSLSPRSLAFLECARRASADGNAR